ncbi:MAG: hypothetical protein RL662_1883 [Bacteroidota bacterium]
MVYNTDVNGTGRCSPIKKAKKKEGITMAAKSSSIVLLIVLEGITAHAR